MNAKSLLRNETAVAIFTDGRNLKIDSEGNGKSGVWRIVKTLRKDKVIIYFRNPKRSSKNEIYLGDFARLTESDVEGLENRFYVVFRNLKLIGETESKWHEFVGSKRGAVNPIKYF